uniref:BMA-GRL-1 n=1 Tax=Brugia malayi TaxID=6279 RepID=A0A0J9XQH7_BRUMA|nr:BMA-GRL-1 [Brugia malayi]
MSHDDGYYISKRSLLLIIFVLNLSSFNATDSDNMRCKCISESKSKCKLTCLDGTNKTDTNHNIERREIDYEEVEIIDERKCNSKSLQNIMLQVTKQAKTKIMRAAEALLGGYFNVICASGDFSYITTTSLYCLQSLGNINCYAFLTGNTRPRLK